MSLTEIIKMLRNAIADNEEPYIYSDGELEAIIDIAACAYSKHRPIKKKCKIRALPGVVEYELPVGFQSWICGLEGCMIYEREADAMQTDADTNRNTSTRHVMELGFTPINGFDIIFTYLSDRRPDEIPRAHVTMLIDYGFYFAVSAAVKQTSDISGLRLGKGLQIQFDNIKELSNAAEKRLLSFNEGMRTCLGGWS